MSTYWYFECLDHDPPMSGDEFTQHTDDEPFKRGVELALNRPIPEDWWDRHSLTGDYFAANACRFLSQHPKCNLGLVDEYGNRRPLSADLDPDEERAERFHANDTEADYYFGPSTSDLESR